MTHKNQWPLEGWQAVAGQNPKSIIFLALFLVASKQKATKSGIIHNIRGFVIASSITSDSFITVTVYT